MYQRNFYVDKFSWVYVVNVMNESFDLEFDVYLVYFVKMFMKQFISC